MNKNEFAGLLDKLIARKMLAGRVVLVVITLLACYLMAGEALYALSDMRPGYSQSYYQTIINYFPRQRAEALYERAEFLYEQSIGESLYIMPHRAGSPGEDAALISHDQGDGEQLLDEAKELLRDLQDSFPTHDEAGRASYLLSRIHLYQEDLDAAEEYAEDYLDTRTGFSLEGHTLMMHLLLEQEKYEEAVKFHADSLEHEEREPVDSHLGILYSDRLAAMGEHQKASDVLEAEQEFLEQWHGEYQEDREHLDPTEQIEPEVFRYEAIIASRKAGLEDILSAESKAPEQDQGVSLSGQVEFSDVQGDAVDEDIFDELQVHLIRPYHQVRSFEMISKAPKADLSEDGEFVFDNLSPGRYSVALAGEAETLSQYYWREQDMPVVELDLQDRTEGNYQVELTQAIELEDPELTDENEFELQWQDVSGAEYYNFGMGELFRDESGDISAIRTTNLIKGISEEQISVAMEELRRQYPGFSSYRDHITPGSVLGIPYPGGEFRPIVSAYDEDGNMLTSSTGYKQFKDEEALNTFEVTGDGALPQGLIQARDMIIDREHIDVITNLEDSYGEMREELNWENDVHYQLALSRLYFHGTNHYGRNRNQEKSLEYQEQLLENVAEQLDLQQDTVEKVTDLDSTEQFNLQLQYLYGKTLLLMEKYEQAADLLDELFQRGMADLQEDEEVYPVSSSVLADTGELLANAFLLDGNVDEAWELRQQVVDIAKNPNQYWDETTLANLILLEEYDTIEEHYYHNTNLRDEYFMALDIMSDDPTSQDEKFYQEYFQPAVLKIVAGQVIDSGYRGDADELIREIYLEYPERQGELYLLIRLYHDMR